LHGGVSSVPHRIALWGKGGLQVGRRKPGSANAACCTSRDVQVRCKLVDLTVAKNSLGLFVQKWALQDQVLGVRLLA
jgi:hypothetical protein